MGYGIWMNVNVGVIPPKYLRRVSFRGRDLRQKTTENSIPMTPGPSFRGAKWMVRGCCQVTPLGFTDHVLEDSGVLYLGSSLYTSKLFLGELVLTKKTA